MTEADFLAAICADPDNDLPREAFADWLDGVDGSHNQMNPAWAEFIRVQIELARDCPLCHGKEGPWSCACVFLRRRERELLEAKVTSRPDGDVHCAEGWSGGTRKAHWGITAFKSLQPTGLLYKDDSDKRRLEWEFRRGFVASVTCTTEDWLRHGDAILTCQPVEEVRLTTWPAVGEGNLRYRWPRVKTWHLPPVDSLIAHPAPLR